MPGVNAAKANQLVKNIFSSSVTRSRLFVDFATLDRQQKIEYTKELFNTEVFTHQEEPLDVLTDSFAKSVTYNASRQTGKTHGICWAASINAAHNLYPALDGLTKMICLANKESQSLIGGNRLRQMMESNWDRFKFFWDQKGSTKTHLVFKKEAGINSKDTGTIDYLTANPQAFSEGFTASILLIDEAGRLDPRVYSETILPYGGSCVLGDTKILTENGYREILKLKNNPGKVWSLNPSSLAYELKPASFIDNGHAEVFEVLLEGDYSVSCTGNEPFLVVDSCETRLKWEKLEDLTVGKFVALGNPPANFENTLTGLESFLLGMLVGDGTYTFNNQPGLIFGKEEKPTREKIQTLIQTEKPFSITGTRVATDRNGTETLYFKQANTNRWNKSGIRQKLEDLNLYGKTSAFKFIPEEVFKQDSSGKFDFLRGYLLTDGCINFEKNSNRVNVLWASVSHQLIKDVQLLLLSLGIKSRVQRFTKRSSVINHKDGKNNTTPGGGYYWQVAISNVTDSLAFLSSINYLYQKEQKRLDGIALCLTKIAKDKGDVIPIRASNGHSTKPHWTRKSMLGTTSIFGKRLAERTSLVWRRIKSIKSIGEQPTYDLTVEDNHNYIANGIILHNTNARTILTGVSRGKGPFYDACNSKDYTHLNYPWDKVETYRRAGPVDLLCPHTGRTILKTGFYPLDMMPLSLKKILFPTNPIAHLLPTSRQKERKVPLWDLSSGKMTESDFRSQYMLEWLSALLAILQLDDIQLIFESSDYEPIHSAEVGDGYYYGLDLGGARNLYATGESNKDTSALSIWRHRDGKKQKVFCEELYSAQPNEIVDWACQWVHPEYGLFKCKYGAVDVTATLGALTSEHLVNRRLPVVPITYNRTEETTKKNFKNAMFDYFDIEAGAGRIQYPKKETTDGLDPDTLRPLNPLWAKCRNQWEIIEREITGGVNARISAPGTEHDDHCNSDVLCVFVMDRPQQFEDQLRSFKKRPRAVFGPALMRR